jgi:hypothetical protein
MNCPHCYREMTRIDDYPALSFIGGFFCYRCDLFIDDGDVLSSDDPNYIRDEKK